MPAKKATNNKKLNPESKTCAFLTTFFSIIGFIAALLLWRKDKYVMYYAKQSLVVFIAVAIFGVFKWILIWIPILGWFLLIILWIYVLFIWLQSWIYALSGEKKPVLFIGELGEKIDL